MGKSEKIHLNTATFFCAAGENSGIRLDLDALFSKTSLDTGSRCQATASADKYSLFEKFCQSGLCRLGLKPLDDINLRGIWMEVEPYVVRLSNYLLTASLSMSKF